MSVSVTYNRVLLQRGWTRLTRVKQLKQQDNLTATRSYGSVSTPSSPTTFVNKFQDDYNKDDSPVKTPVFPNRRDTDLPSSKSDINKIRRQSFSYAIAGAAAATGAVGAKGIVQFLGSTVTPYLVDPLDKVIEVTLDQIPEGENFILQFRGRPVFVRHRTADQIQKAQEDDNSPELKDPATDADRTKKPEWLVVKGICTHLGCIPISGLGDYGGYYCPCHGSHYDLSARIRKGPAPLNLEVPKYMFKDENTLLLGKDENSPPEED